MTGRVLLTYPPDAPTAAIPVYRPPASARAASAARTAAVAFVGLVLGTGVAFGLLCLLLALVPGMFLAVLR